MSTAIYKPLRLLDNQCGNLLVLGYILTKGRTMDSLKVSVFGSFCVTFLCLLRTFISQTV
uniref:Uncharacterized protein n=1 Tax=Anguilla anguilla TaxID=7936 RepID=A0A0E9UX27_ANGAN